MNINSWTYLDIIYLNSNKCGRAVPRKHNTLVEPFPENTILWTDVSLMLAHRLRRWSNIKPALGKSIVFAVLLVPWLYIPGIADIRCTLICVLNCTWLSSVRYPEMSPIHSIPFWQMSSYLNKDRRSYVMQNWNESGFRPPLCTYRLNWARRTLLGMVRWMRWHCPPDTGFEIWALAVWGRARYFSVTEAEFQTWMGKKHFRFFQTAETGNWTPNSSVKGSGANHYPGASARMSFNNQ